MHQYRAPIPEPCPTCGGRHLHCPYCGFPVTLWPQAGTTTSHHCTACGGGRVLDLTQVPAPVAAPVPSAAWSGSAAPGPARPGAGDPVAAQREAIARAFQAPPAPEPEPEETEPEETDLELWSDALAPLVNHGSRLLSEWTDSVRILERQVIARVRPRAIGPTYLWGPGVGSPNLAERLSEHFGRKVTILPASHLPPCPRDAERQPLSHWRAMHADPDLAAAEPATVARVYRLVFDAYPFRPQQTNTYSRRELELLGLLPPLPTL